MAETEKPAGGPQFVGKKEELIAAVQSLKTVEGRAVLVIYSQEAFHALDLYCYHEGTPLQSGDIEELDGKMCIICPKHKYKISLAKGECIYKAPDLTQMPPVAKWFSRGFKQRVHTVTESNGDVFVQLTAQPAKVESDYFQGEEGRIRRDKVKAADEQKAAALAEKKAAKKAAS